VFSASNAATLLCMPLHLQAQRPPSRSSRICIRLVLLLPALMSLCSAAWSNTPVSFKDGEEFLFRVSWGIFRNAGEIAINAREETVAGLPQIRLTTQTETKGFVRNLYFFEGVVVSIFDRDDGRLLAATATTSMKKKKTHAMAVFDYAGGRVLYEDFLRPERSANIPIPEGQPKDLITSLIEARTWDLKVGDRRPVTVMFDDEFYDLVLVAERIEEVDTPLGRGPALVVKPVMEQSPKGMFKRGGTVRVWISQDEKRLPVKLEVSLKYGTGVATLIHYRPPTTAVALLGD
jgi:Protein of unknown function (DUF3108).